MVGMIRIALLAGVTFICMNARAQNSANDPQSMPGPGKILSVPGSESRPQWFTAEEWNQSTHADPKDLQWFTDARYGLFIHFGVSSLKGVELGWGRRTHIAPDTGKGPVPDAVYDNLYKDFKLEHFDARTWVKTARSAGMKYIVVITKHHDGFHMWDTAFSDYKITNSPFGRDYIKEVVDACHEEHMPVGLYFSQRDWYHPDYDPRHVHPERDHAKYKAYMSSAVKELMTKYGKIDILWFDAAYWTGMFKAEYWDSENVCRMARELQPHIIINNRASIPGDFDTPEQHVGAMSRRRPWESCMTLGSMWSWKPNDKLKTTDQAIQLLTQTLGGDGNLLLDVGPMPDGAIEDRQVALLQEMGKWVDAHQEAIYKTRGGPFIPGPWGSSTCREKDAYLFISPSVGTVLNLPAINARIVDAIDLDTGHPVTIEVKDQQWILTLPPRPAAQPASGRPMVVKIRTDTDVFALEPVHVKTNDTTGKK